ncbi:hypothetical protein [Synechococcus sp. GFB01]|uniref:hypothetical protein n=1 Tax=Synechococcus sp. GFB01 TaxID=1662190 RepID=UPI000A4FA122|nr:hypothetical protein [Synechococcus sp. GFB01]
MSLNPVLSAALMLAMLLGSFPATVLADGASSPAEETPVERMRRLLREAQNTNRELDRQEGKKPGVDIPEQPDADPRMRGWKREYEEAKQQWDLAKETLGKDFERLRNPDLVDPTNTCWQKIQDYYRAIARVYKDWQAPNPGRKGTFITRIDFDIHTQASTDNRREEPAKPLADNFVITQYSGEAAQDRSAYSEAQRKAPDLHIRLSVRLLHCAFFTSSSFNTHEKNW